MTLALSPKARPIAHILALLPILAVIAFVDMGLPHWLGVADAYAGFATVYLDELDVVRHRLVKDIILAYAADEARAEDE